MPSNECTNTLMELSFAVGNMIGAEACDRDDYIQLQGILNAWECSKRGKTSDEYDNMKAAVATALKNCDSTTGSCSPTDCVNIWTQHNDLITEMGLFDQTALGRGKRAAIPPKVKGQEGIGRQLTLEQLRTTSNWPTNKQTEAQKEAQLAAEKKAEDAAAAAAAAKAATAAAPPKPRQRRAATPTAGTGRYGKEEERWYPQRLAR